MKFSNFRPIYCDMDGVLVNFIDAMERSVRRHLRFNGNPFDINIPIDQLWELAHKDLEERFWSEMEWLPGSKKLWEFLVPHNPRILSAVPPGGTPKIFAWSEKGKRIWCKRHLGISGARVNIVTREQKQRYAKDAILIDDLKKNIDEWNSAGGTGVLFRTPNQAISDLKKLGL